MPTFPTINFPKFSNTQPSLKDLVSKPTSTTIDSREWVKKASILVLGTFVTAGTVYLGYKKLFQSNPIDSNSNYLTPIAATILLPTIALAANHLKGQKPKLSKEDPSNSISNILTENKDKIDLKGLAKQKMITIGLEAEVAEKLVNSDYFSCFLDSFWEAEVSLEDLQNLVETSEKWELENNFIAKLTDAGIPQNVAKDAALILPREELTSTLNNKLTKVEIETYPMYIENRKKQKAWSIFDKHSIDRDPEKVKEIIRLFSEDEFYDFIANEDVKKALENFEYKKTIKLSLKNNIESEILVEKILKNIPFHMLDIIAKNYAENEIMERIFATSAIIDLVRQEFISKLANSGIPEKAVKEASQLFDILSLCRNISNELDDNYIQSFEEELDRLKKEWAIDIFTENGIDAEKAKEAVNLWSGDKLFEFLRFEQTLDDLNKIIDNVEIKPLYQSFDEPNKSIQYL